MRAESIKEVDALLIQPQGALWPAIPVRVLGLQAGGRFKVVFGQLGRASIAIILGVFSQVMTDMQEEAALSLQNRAQDRPASGVLDGD